MKARRDKRKAQVAIFIVLAIAIVAALVLYLLLRGPGATTGSSDPEAYIIDCIKDSAQKAATIIMENGGDIKPELTIMYQGKNITYLCYNQGFYKPCINQRPMLIEHIEEEITDYIRPDIEECFSSLSQELENRDYQVTIGNMNVKTELQPKRAVVNVDREITISKSGQTTSIKNFEMDFTTPVYELSEIAMEIVNQEAQYCNFENLGFMIIYPDYDIRKERAEDSLVYLIKEVNTQQQFKFAVRGCVMPAGL
jgi:hypothetical protein